MLNEEQRRAYSELLRSERVAEAATFAEGLGAHLEASMAFERACNFAAAADAAQRAGDPLRALDLARRGGDAEACDRALAHITNSIRGGTLGADRATHLAETLEARGDFRWAGELFALGAPSLVARENAARCFAAAGFALRAATLLEADGNRVGAAKVLEGRVRNTPNDFAACVALAKYLVEFGKREAALRLLQGVPKEAPAYPAALRQLVPLLQHLGLDHAASVARAELLRVNGDDEGAPSTSVGDAQEINPNGGDSTGGQQPATVLFGRYEVIREIARTPTARVVLAKDRAAVTDDRPGSGRPAFSGSAAVAVKLFAPPVGPFGRDARIRFVREVEVLRSLHHPHILPLIDFLPEGPAVVTPWMTGGDLSALLAAKRLSPRRAVEILRGLLSALGEAHRRGILHRDIKPANVLLDAVGNAFLADFGAAHLGDLSSTATAGVLGSLGYMSPEAARGEPASVRGDLYSVAAVFYTMLLGRPPVGEDRVTSFRPLFGAFDESHDALFARWLSPDPANRPASAAMAVAELDALAWPEEIAGVQRPRSDDRRAPSESSSLRGTRWVDEAHDDLPGTLYTDTLLQRRVRALEADQKMIERARLFSAQELRVLQAILHLDDRLWLEEPRPLHDAEDPALPRVDARLCELETALRMLHERGFVHGSIDEKHLVPCANRTLVLRLSAPPTDGATPQKDMEDLERVGHVLRLSRERTIR